MICGILDGLSGVSNAVEIQYLIKVDDTIGLFSHQLSNTLSNVPEAISKQARKENYDSHGLFFGK